MKKLMFGIVAFATCMMLASCGAKKAAVAEQQPQYPNYAGQYPPQYPNYAGQYPPQYPQQYPPQQYYGQYPQQPAPQQPQVVADPRFTQEIAQSPIMLAAKQAKNGEIRAFGEGVSTNSAVAYDKARARGIQNLQEKIETYVKRGLKLFNDETIVNDQASVDEKTQNEIILASKNAAFSGADELDSRVLYDSQTKAYKYEVCMVYNRAGILNAMEQQSQRIVKNRQKFEQEMQEIWDEIDREHGVIPIREEQANRKNEQEQQNLDRANQRVVNVMDAQTRHDVGVINAANGKSIYYLVLNGQQQGPFAYEQLQAMVASRQMNIETKVWREGLATWVSAGSLQELSGLFSVMPTGSVPPPVY